MHKTQTIPKSASKLVNAPLGNGTVKTAQKPKEPLDKFTYALAAYTVERRETG